MITKPTYWTEARVSTVLKEMVDLLESEENKPVRKQFIFIGQLCNHFKIYRQMISEWGLKYSDVEEITDTIKKIHAIFETRINVGALQGDLQFVPAIFNLKNNYGWKDESTVHDDAKIKANSDLAEIRDRLAHRTKRNIRNKK